MGKPTGVRVCDGRYIIHVSIAFLLVRRNGKRREAIAFDRSYPPSLTVLLRVMSLYGMVCCVVIKIADGVGAGVGVWVEQKLFICFVFACLCTRVDVATYIISFHSLGSLVVSKFDFFCYLFHLWVVVSVFSLMVLMFLLRGNSCGFECAICANGVFRQATRIDVKMEG